MLEKIGKYEIRLQIGRGSMGVVYEAWDTQIERRVALKTLRTDQFEVTQLSDLLARFKREAQSVGRLSHPHIVTIYDYGDWQGTPYIVMEYISGRELAHDLERRARFPLEDVVRIMTQMLGALGHAHERGVVHRDLKPANMFLLDDGSLKVVDFGIARLDDADATLLTRSGDVLGTPAYMSPEQVDALPVDHRSDLFSAGIILYELLVGERPFKGESVHTVKQAVRKLEPLAPSEANPTLTEAWDKVISRALSKKPAARYENARQFAEAIKAAHQAERAHGEESRLKAAEANEHALRAAEERSRAEALRRVEEDRREAEQVAKAEAQARKMAEESVRREAELRARAEANAKATPSSLPPAPAAVASARSRVPAIAAAVVMAALAIGSYLYVRQSADGEAAKSESARIAAESRAREETEKRSKAEALARAETEHRARLESDVARREAEAKREAEISAKVRADDEARKAAEEKAKILATKKEEETRALLLKVEKETEAKAKARSEELAAAEATKKAEESAQREAREKANLDAKKKKAEEIRQLARKPGAVFQDCPDCPRMVVIPAGEFTMGSSEWEARRSSDEVPQRLVRIPRVFAMGRTEVTQGEWRAIMGINQSEFSKCGDDCPVEQVSWNSARDFVRILSEKTGRRYRLPSESEWEYACRGGGSDQFCGSGDAGNVAWYRSNSGWKTHRVAQKRPNAFGLYDMSGNAWEWTEDCWNSSYASAPSNGSAWLSGDCSQRVLRGGGFGHSSDGVRAAFREKSAAEFFSISTGFRVAMTVE